MVYIMRIQLFGFRAKSLLADAKDPHSMRHMNILEPQLQALSLSMPHRVKPINQSGFMLCYYDDDVRVRFISLIIRRAFVKTLQAGMAASYPCLSPHHV